MIQEYARIFKDDIIDFGKQSVDAQNHLINQIYAYVDENFRGTYEYDIMNKMLTNVEYYFFHINDTVETHIEILTKLNKERGWNMSEKEILDMAKEDFEEEQNDERIKWVKQFV
jgi:hypothetical protein